MSGDKKQPKANSRGLYVLELTEAEMAALLWLLEHPANNTRWRTLERIGLKVKTVYRVMRAFRKMRRLALIKERQEKGVRRRSLTISTRAYDTISATALVNNKPRSRVLEGWINTFLDKVEDKADVQAIESRQDEVDIAWDVVKAELDVE